LFDIAQKEQESTGSQLGYKVWVEYLLREYYDPMYDYQIEMNHARIIFRGSSEEIEDYFSTHMSESCR
jgi:tRNA 2-selenouridine synthase